MVSEDVFDLVNVQACELCDFQVVGHVCVMISGFVMVRLVNLLLRSA
jgi:hypothetical protein